MKIKYYVFITDSELTVIMGDGGVATAYKPEDHFKTNYYQTRLTKDSNLDTMWDKLGEGEMYWGDWDGTKLSRKDAIDDEMILDAAEWLFMATEPVEFERINMGELNEDTFKQVLSELKFEE